jgi:hypothetical protein
MKNSEYYAQLVLVLVISSFISAATGCGRNLPEGKVRVSGTVLLNGEPLTHDKEGMFTINFASKQNSHTSAARFDRANGTFELIIEPGEYIASVTATDGYDEDDEKRGRIIPAKSLIPEKYNLLNTSDATVTVGPSGGRITVELTK